MQRRNLLILSCIFFTILCAIFLSNEMVDLKKSQNLHVTKGNNIYETIYLTQNKLSDQVTSNGIKFFLVKNLAKKLASGLKPSEYDYYLLDEECFVDTWDFIYGMFDYKTCRKPTHQEMTNHYRESSQGILRIFFPLHQAVIYYFAKIIQFLSLGFSPYLLAIFIKILLSSIVIKYALIATPIILFFIMPSIARAQQNKPVNIFKLNTATDGHENKFTLGLLHLKPKTGILGLIPKNGMEFGYGTNVWFSGKFGKGFIFNPISLTTTKNDWGLTVADCHIWNIVSAKVKNLNFVSMSFFSQPLIPKRDKLFYSKNQLVMGNFGARSEITWKKKWKQLLGPVYCQNLHEKIKILFFANFIQPYSLKVEFSASL